MKRILVVEDEFLLAAHICDLLEDEGLEMIGPAASLSEAIDLASREALDGALLDINIIGGRIDDVADILARRGVPFIFVTASGRDDLPPNFMDATLVNKPFSDGALMREVRLIGQLAPCGACWE
jgi:DNA-binding response OmpR family regulator